MFGRDEKVSPMRLTAVQYIVLGIFLILAYGLWRLQVVQSDFYASLAEKNPELAAQYASRMVQIVDGRTVSDTGSRLVPQ